MTKPTPEAIAKNIALNLFAVLIFGIFANIISFVGFEIIETTGFNIHGPATTLIVVISVIIGLVMGAKCRKWISSEVFEYPLAKWSLVILLLLIITPVVFILLMKAIWL